MHTKKVIFSALLIATGIGVGNVSAQDAPTCDNITWSAEALETNPAIADQCLEIVDRGGQNVVRMHAEIMSQTATGPFVRYATPDGKWGKVRRANPPGGLKAILDGKEVAVNKLVKRQEINVYVAEPFWAAPAAPVVEAVAVVEEFVEPAPEPAPVALPTTASNLPLVALFGALLLMLGGVVRTVRNRD
ncbi:MAG: hypothetical protein IMF09_04240 [Proteobacteria bacterium]|nr:hypothetical protein [Pseudomonadota bacterium]